MRHKRMALSFTMRFGVYFVAFSMSWCVFWVNGASAQNMDGFAADLIFGASSTSSIARFQIDTGGSNLAKEGSVAPHYVNSWLLAAWVTRKLETQTTGRCATVITDADYPIFSGHLLIKNSLSHGSEKKCKDYLRELIENSDLQAIEFEDVMRDVRRSKKGRSEIGSVLDEIEALISAVIQKFLPKSSSWVEIKTIDWSGARSIDVTAVTTWIKEQRSNRAIKLLFDDERVQPGKASSAKLRAPKAFVAERDISVTWQQLVYIAPTIVVVGVGDGDMVNGMIVNSNIRQLCKFGAGGKTGSQEHTETLVRCHLQHLNEYGHVLAIYRMKSEEDARTSKDVLSDMMLDARIVDLAQSNIFFNEGKPLMVRIDERPN